MASSSWYPDPLGLHEKRFFNGVVWTDLVSDGGTESRSPLGNITPQLPAGAVPLAPTSQYVIVAPQRAGNGFAVAGFTLGLIGAVISSTSPFGFVMGGLCGLLGVIFGLLGLNAARAHDATLGGLALSGLILGLIAVIIAVNTGMSYHRLGNAIRHAFSTTTTLAPLDATPAVNKVRITDCFQVQPSGIPAAAGTLVNTSDRIQTFRVTVAFGGPTPTRAETTTGPVLVGASASWTVGASTTSFKPSSCKIVRASSASP